METPNKENMGRRDMENRGHLHLRKQHLTPLFAARENETGCDLLARRGPIEAEPFG